MLGLPHWLIVNLYVQSRPRPRRPNGDADAKQRWPRSAGPMRWTCRCATGLPFACPWAKVLAIAVLGLIPTLGLGGLKTHATPRSWRR